MATGKTRQGGGKKSGGNGGGLAAILSMFGGGAYSPEIGGGEALDPMQGPGLSPEAAAPATAPLTVDNKPSWWQNFLSKGQAQQQYGALQNNLKLGAFDNAQKMSQIGAHNIGQLGLENLRHTNDLSEAENKNIALKQQAAAKFEQDKILARLNAALTNKVSTPEQFDESVAPLTLAENSGKLQNQNVLNAAYKTPDLMTALVQSEYAKLNKGGIDNLQTQANTDLTQAKVGPARFMGVGDNVQVDPINGQYFSNQKPFNYNPDNTLVRGGFNTGVLPPQQGGFRKVQGGVNAEVIAPTNQPQVSMPTPQPFQFNTAIPGASTTPFNANPLPPAGTLEELIRRFKIPNALGY